jgi:two-component system, sensor histidine kinase RpfC
MKGLIERIGLSPQLANNPEFQSALVRISACLFGASYIALGAATEYYRVDVPYYLVLFGIYLASNVGFLISIARRPQWPARVYVGICLDVVAISLAIFITREAISPFYLLYILVFISAGTRFGKHHLMVASLAAVIAYNIVLVALDGWGRHTFEAIFFLVLLVLLPLYQFSLLRKVQDARAEAEKANRAKGDFLAFMTHELRTPLTGVIGMAELLKGTRLDAEQHDYVESIAGSADVLATLIGDILDFSKIDARQLVLERLPFDPRIPVREVCGALAHRARSAGLELICDLAPDVPRLVLGDQLRVRQILLNLLGNAVKFTEHGQVMLRVSMRPAEAGLERPHLLFEVADTGIGIAEEKLPHLFESFRQADESTTRRFGGTGLGTTIARDLTLLMGGAIGVESALGRGSRFWIRLPLLDEMPSAGAESHPRLVDRRILILERNDSCRALARAAFEREGAGCIALAGPDALEGIDLLENKVDLVVMADHPKGLDFDAALAAVAARRGGTLPCLFTVYPGHRPQGLSTAYRCLIKPYLAEDLIAAAEALFEPVLSPSDKPQSGMVDAPAPGLAPVANASRSRVLVAEDNEIAARVITSFLGRMGFEPTRVADGEAALAEALSGRYGIAIVDLRMPKLDGIGFARRYREQAPDRPMPIVALTANASADIKQTCLASGMDAFLSKPVRPDDLRRMLEMAVQSGSGS